MPRTAHRSPNRRPSPVACSIASCTRTVCRRSPIRAAYHGCPHGGRHAALGRPVQRGERPAGRRFHPLDRRRPGLAADDIAGSIAHVRGLGRAGLLTGDEVDELVAGLTALAEDVAAGRIDWDPSLEDVHLNLEAALADADRAGRRQAPHRPLAQRPGRHGPAALDAAGDRPLDAGWSPSSARSSGSPSVTASAILPGYDPHPARPARAVRPPSAGLRRDGRARPGPAGRRPPARRTCRRWPRARWPAPATRSTARRRPASSASTASPRTRSTRSATGTSSSRRCRRSRSGWSISAGWPRS